MRPAIDCFRSLEDDLGANMYLQICNAYSTTLRLYVPRSNIKPCQPLVINTPNMLTFYNTCSEGECYPALNAAEPGTVLGVGAPLLESMGVSGNREGLLQGPQNN